jgi:hypothetical protein
MPLENQARKRLCSLSLSNLTGLVSLQIFYKQKRLTHSTLRSLPPPQTTPPGLLQRNWPLPSSSCFLMRLVQLMVRKFLYMGLIN